MRSEQTHTQRMQPLRQSRRRNMQNPVSVQRQRLENLIRHLQRIVKKLLRQEKPRNQRKILQLRKLLQKMVPGFESPYRLSRIL